MNPAPDYSAAYVILETNHQDSHTGHGVTFTIGRGNDICVGAIKLMAGLVDGWNLEDLFADMRAVWRIVTSDSQLRWEGPDKGVIHLAAVALLNALWDLYAKAWL